MDEAATLLAWADELGIDVSGEGPAVAEAAPPGIVSAEAAAATTDTVVRALLVKGFAVPEGLAPAMSTTTEDVEGILNRLTADGLAELTGGMFQLTADGKALGGEMMANDRREWGEDNAAGALESLVPLDERMKDIMTRWQMREFKGRQILNDHTDAAHDAAVLEDFASLHGDAARWLSSLVEALSRLGSYATRLDHAAERVADGDHDYLASPRVDSYHTVWFELHEDLILLAGRTREEEAAAGRA